MAQKNDGIEMSFSDIFDHESASGDTDNTTDAGKGTAERIDPASSHQIPSEISRQTCPLLSPRLVVGSENWRSMMSEMWTGADRRDAHAMGQPHTQATGLFTNTPSFIDPQQLTVIADSLAPEHKANSNEVLTSLEPDQSHVHKSSENETATAPCFDWLALLNQIERPNRIDCPACGQDILPGFATFPNANEFSTPPDFFVCHKKDAYDYIGILETLALLFKSCIMRTACHCNVVRAVKNHDAVQEITQALLNQLRPALTSIRVALEQFFQCCFPDTPELRAAVVAALLDPSTTYTDWISDHHP